MHNSFEYDIGTGMSDFDFTVNGTLIFPFAEGSSFECNAILGDSQRHGKHFAAVERCKRLPFNRRFRQRELTALPVERHRQLHAVPVLGHDKPRNVLSAFSRIAV